jgi:hypothetical protein
MGYDVYPSGAAFAGLSNSAVAVTGLWSISHNQAGLANLNGFSGGVYQEQRFLLKELGLSALALALPVKPGTLGMDYSYFGYSKYHESQAGICFAKMLGKKFSAGIKIDYFSTFISNDYNRYTRVSFETGFLAYLTEKLSVGFHLFNPFPSKTNPNDKSYLPSIANLGIAYKLYEKLMFTAETEKDYKLSPVYKAGVEFTAANQLFLRAGINTEPSSYSFGLGYSISHLTIDMAFSNHQVLGLTPHFSLTYQL